jgi:predicted DNA-binding transcriptional regulator AlpA
MTTSNPFEAAIEAAVERALDAKVPTIIEALRSAMPAPASDRFVPIREAAPKFLGMTPSTAWRLEKRGLLPPREHMGGHVGYRLSMLDSILSNLPG